MIISVMRQGVDDVGCEVNDGVERNVGDDEVIVGGGLVGIVPEGAFCDFHDIRDAIGLNVFQSDFDRNAIDVQSEDARGAEPGGGDGEYAGT